MIASAAQRLTEAGDDITGENIRKEIPSAVASDVFQKYAYTKGGTYGENGVAQYESLLATFDDAGRVVPFKE